MEVEGSPDAEMNVLPDEPNHKEPVLAMEIDLEKVSSATLRRLIEEVRNDIQEDISPYSRWHNRHNRSR